MDYKGRDANKHLTLTIGLANVTQGRWNDSDCLIPSVLYNVGICLVVCQ